MRIAFIGASEEVKNIIKNFIKEDHEIMVIDDDKNRIEDIRREFDVASFLGDLLNFNIYSEIGLHKADMVIVAHPQDTINVIVCMYAKKLGVPRIIAIVSDRKIADVVKGFDIVSDVIVRSDEISFKIIEKIYNIDYIHIDAENVIAVIDTDKLRQYIGRNIKELFDEEVKILLILTRDGNILHINNNQDYVVKDGDRIIIYTKISKLKEISGIE